MIRNLFRRVKAEPVPIENLSRESQAILLNGLKAQVRALDQRIDEERLGSRNNGQRAVDHDAFARQARQAAAEHDKSARSLLEQRDAISRTIHDMGGRE